LLRAHGAAVQAYRAEGRHEVGLVVNLEPKYPATDRAEDVDATARADAYVNRQYLDPVLLGAYPDALRELFGEAWPEWPASDMSLIRQPIDFLGVNYYSRSVTRDASLVSALDLAREGTHAVPPTVFPVRVVRVRQAHQAHTTMDWEVFPQGLEDVLRWVRQRYGDLPVYVTENGAAFYDAPAAGAGRVDDPLRVAYFREHLRAVRRAIEAGVDVRGYFAWSLLDNFEWSYGYTQRFGIVHVDYSTQRRTPKASARFYADVARTGGRALAT
jgi:beta-glucosidase